MAGFAGSLLGTGIADYTVDEDLVSEGNNGDERCQYEYATEHGKRD
jgi:hypothetical protein